MSTICIEYGGAAEIDAVMPVMAGAFDPSFGEAWSASQLLGSLSLPGSALHLTRSGGQAIGFALSRSIAESCELMLLAVMPIHRGRGIGRALLETVVAEAVTRRARVLFLEMRAGNPAERLYRAAGFVRAGSRPAYYRGPAGELFDGETWRRDLT